RDWSSDVCSSDLHHDRHDHGADEHDQERGEQQPGGGLGSHRASSASSPISRMIWTISVWVCGSMSTRGTAPLTAFDIPSPTIAAARCINGAQVQSRFCPSAIGTMTSSL